MKRMPVFLDSFSGKVGDLTRKQKKDPMLVLEAISKDPRVSTWDMSEDNLWRTVSDLERKGFLIDESSKSVYPWCRFVITKAGRRALASNNNTR